MLKEVLRKILIPFYILQEVAANKIYVSLTFSLKYPELTKSLGAYLLRTGWLGYGFLYCYVFLLLTGIVYFWFACQKGFYFMLICFATIILLNIVTLSPYAPYPTSRPNADWWILTSANTAGTNGLACLSKHTGA
jgi:hypothetical protein